MRRLDCFSKVFCGNRHHPALRAPLLDRGGEFISANTFEKHYHAFAGKLNRLWTKPSDRFQRSLT